MHPMNLPVRVVTDSASDLPASLAADHDVRIVPLTVRFGSNEYVDGEELTSERFWELLETTSHLPETAPPPPYRFEREIKEARNDGAPGVLIVTMSSAISATFQAAALAAERLGSTIPVKVIDSRTLSMAQGFAAVAAAQTAADGGSLDDVAAAALSASASSGVLAAVETLEFLRRGGRIGGLSAMVANALDVKPILGMEDGVVSGAGRARTREAAIEVIAEQVLGLPSLVELAIVHGRANDVGTLIEAVRPRIEPERIVIADMGPVIATHAGPGVLGVAFRTR